MARLKNVTPEMLAQAAVSRSAKIDAHQNLTERENPSPSTPRLQQAAKRNLPLSIADRDASPICRTVLTAGRDPDSQLKRKLLTEPRRGDSRSPAFREREEIGSESAVAPKRRRVDIQQERAVVNSSANLDKPSSGVAQKDDHAEQEKANPVTEGDRQEEKQDQSSLTKRVSAPLPGKASCLTSSARAQEAGHLQPGPSEISPAMFRAIYHDPGLLEEFPSANTISPHKAPRPPGSENPLATPPVNIAQQSVHQLKELITLENFHNTRHLPTFDTVAVNAGAPVDRHQYMFRTCQTAEGLNFFTTRIKSNLNILEAILANATARKAAFMLLNRSDTSPDDFYVQTLTDEVKLSRLALMRVEIAGKISPDTVEQAELLTAFWQFCNISQEMKMLIDGLVSAYGASGVEGSVQGLVSRHSNEAWDLQSQR